MLADGALTEEAELAEAVDDLGLAEAALKLNAEVEGKRLKREKGTSGQPAEGKDKRTELGHKAAVVGAMNVIRHRYKREVMADVLERGPTGPIGESAALQ